MGGFATLHFGMTYQSRALSLVVAGCGYGAQPDKREQFKAETFATVDGELLKLPSKEFDLLAALARDPHRVHMKEDLMERIWGYQIGRAHV